MAVRSEALRLEAHRATEPASEVKREWMNGEVVAMGGAAPAHNRVGQALGALLWPQLGPRGCASYGSDQRIRVGETGAYLYPDLVIASGPRHFVGPAPGTLTNPTVVIEILSPSTASYDQGPKLPH